MPVVVIVAVSSQGKPESVGSLAREGEARCAPPSSGPRGGYVGGNVTQRLPRKPTLWTSGIRTKLTNTRHTLET